MRIWLACFGVLFAIAELYQWVKHLTLPLPIYILGGVFLVIASNYNKRANLRWWESTADSEPIIDASSHSSGSWGKVTPQSPESISFTIRRSAEPNE